MRKSTPTITSNVGEVGRESQIVFTKIQVIQNVIVFKINPLECLYYEPFKYRNGTSHQFLIADLVVEKKQLLEIIVRTLNVVGLGIYGGFKNWIITFIF